MIATSVVIEHRWHTVTEVAEMLGFGLSKTKVLVLTGQMRSVKIGCNRRVLQHPQITMTMDVHTEASEEEVRSALRQFSEAMGGASWHQPLLYFAAVRHERAPPRVTRAEL